MKSIWARALLLLLASVCTSQATQIAYTINFTTDFGPTATGSLTYDAAVPAFSNFIVFWNGLKFDLTASANTPSDDGATGPACLGGLTGAAAGFAWLNAGCQTFPVGWDADTTPSAGNSVIASFNFPEQNSDLQIGIHGDGSAADDDDTDSRGTFTISQTATTPTPEPDTFGVFVIGAGLLMLLRIRRNATVGDGRE